MFDIGLQEMMVIGVLALLVFGPSKLPELGRTVGRMLREFRRASDEFRSTVETNLHINDPDPIIPPDTSATAPPLDTSLPSTLESVAPAESVPGLETTGEPAPVATEHGEPYVAKRAARLFHRRECSWVGAIAEIDRVYLKRVPDAREQGFIECPACEPWEPA
jgi:Tat protein translocase TatB subunit